MELPVGLVRSDGEGKTAAGAGEVIMKEAILTKGLTKRYGEKMAVDGVNLTVFEGELFALLGVNGAGKTTTIRLLSCLSAPTAGTAEVFGHDVQKEPEMVKRLIGISTQDTAVAENLTVEENLAFMAGIFCESGRNRKASGSMKKAEGSSGRVEGRFEGTFGKSEKSVRERVEEIIGIFHLEEVRKKRAKTLSGGWKRKLSIAMAIISDPKVLYLDEPTLGLDVLARRELWREIEALKDRMTIILTTHYMEEAEALADRIAIMMEGKIVTVGTLAELEKLTGKKGLENVFVEIAEKGCPA